MPMNKSYNPTPSSKPSPTDGDASSLNTAMHEMENRLKGLQLAIDTSDDWLWDLNLETRTLNFFGTWYQRLSFTEKEDVGLEVIEKWILRIHPEDQHDLLYSVDRLFNGQLNRLEQKYRVRENTGDYFWVHTKMKAYRDSSGQIKRITGVNKDIDLQQREIDRLKKLAYSDQITGMHNKVALKEHLDSRFETYSPNLINGSVLLIGLDYFKFANTTYGHYVGDRILKTIAETILSEASQYHAFAARYEGDQFCIVLNQQDELFVQDFSKMLLSEISRIIHIEHDEFSITASIGIATFPLHGTSYEELIKNATSALIAAKNLGKNKYLFYEYTQNQSLIEKWTLTQELSAAIENEELRLVFQPIIDLKNREPLGFEALVRWHNRKLGLVPPNRFITLAEETGLIDKIDQWVLYNSIKFIQRFNEAYDTQYYVSINISSINLGKQEFVDYIKSIIDNESIHTEYIKIEITEHALITSFEDTRLMIEELKEMGIQVFLDDFGTGYSSFNYLKNLPVDLVKLDMSFIADLIDDEQTQRLIDGIIQLAHILNLRICAEGIEYVKQESVLKNLSCDLGQGYLYSKPLEESTLCQMIENNSFKF